MSQCDRVLDVLRDGQWHTIREIHDRAGTMRLNSRISELRVKRGLHIVCTRVRGEYAYQLIDTLEEREVSNPIPVGEKTDDRSSSRSTDNSASLSSSAPTANGGAYALTTDGPIGAGSAVPASPVPPVGPEVCAQGALDIETLGELLAEHGFVEFIDEPQLALDLVGAHA